MNPTTQETASGLSSELGTATVQLGEAGTFMLPAKGPLLMLSAEDLAKMPRIELRQFNNEAGRVLLDPEGKLIFSGDSDAAAQALINALNPSRTPPDGAACLFFADLHGMLASYFEAHRAPDTDAPEAAQELGSGDHELLPG